jgi:hypothetical protein
MLIKFQIVVFWDMTMITNILDKLWVNLFHLWGTQAYYGQTKDQALHKILVFQTS